MHSTIRRPSSTSCWCWRPTIRETQAALLAIDLPGNFRTIIVPALAPQTKPKALNYAMQFARGEFVVVYDAEDRPEPGQLRQALEVFRAGAPDAGVRAGPAQYLQPLPAAG